MRVAGLEPGAREDVRSPLETSDVSETGGGAASLSNRPDLSRSRWLPLPGQNPRLNKIKQSPVHVAGGAPHLDNVELGQEVAVRQRELIPIQELAPRNRHLLRAVGVHLVGQGAVQVIVQLLQGPQQVLLVNWNRKVKEDGRSPVSGRHLPLDTEEGGRPGLTLLDIALPRMRPCSF